MARTPIRPASRAPEVPEYVSPEVSADGRVTIRYYHPTAKTVWCEGEWREWEPLAMQPNGTGIWSCTTKPLVPDIYEYCLFADGARVVDYQNPAMKNRFTHFVHVPGKGAFETRPVPHGTTHVHWYHSAITGTARRMHVYTPPGYEAGTAGKYPVLYLFHGAGDDDDGWVRTGRMNFIMDNLIAEGRARPMVVAMPHGHMLGTNWRERRETKIRAFAEDFYKHVMPEVEGLYRVGRERKERAMAGLSMGGAQTIATGMTQPKLFGAYGVFSSGLWPEMLPFIGPGLAEMQKDPPETLWVGIGKRDFLYENCTLLRRTLEEAKVPFTYYEDNTTHSWRAWRDYLERFAPLLFRGP